MCLLVQLCEKGGRPISCALDHHFSQERDSVSEIQVDGSQRLKLKVNLWIPYASLSAILSVHWVTNGVTSVF